jgi:ubiquinone/menaquinone biosynthesis C-methylase UbiE
VSQLDASRVKDIVRRHWSRRASDFDTAPTHGLLSDLQREAWTGALKRWAGPRALDVLDVGCGTGFLAIQLAALGHRVSGLDDAEPMLTLARSKSEAAGLNVSWHQGDAEHPPFADATFDLVVERHVIWTLPDPDAAVAEWLRLLRPGGRVVLIEGDWRRGSARRTDEYAQIEYALPLYGGRPASMLRDLLTAAGYVNLTVEPLMESALWGTPPERERYALLGSTRVPRMH